MNINRKKMHRQTFGIIEDNAKMLDILYENAQSNMKETLRKLDLNQMKRIAGILHNARQVTFLGNEHELAVFHTVQLDLIGEGIPAFLQYHAALQKNVLHNLQDGDVVVVINAFEKWLGEDMRMELSDLKNRKDIRIVGFFQEDVESLRKLSDEYCLYGETDSHNQAFYSLLLLSQMLSEMMYEM